MKLVILGNGFDKANGLPTSYSDFFQFSYLKNKELFTEIDILFEEKFPVTQFLNYNDSINTRNNSVEKYQHLVSIDLKFINNKYDFIVNMIKDKNRKLQ